ncbi:LuxR family transcriptional regulator [Caballeronia hypogeia]|uniref:LuxR family transcriptional regulator n=1 Tax=Caballeronia hypogeia TaxID=1777140 RepID=A0A157ZDY2_9BURK|nr:hypothetical protein [Caballeronia hypogeia]SAK43639.1 LuxR family transcriptional regulator [Caballeronia hypogeia]
MQRVDAIHRAIQSIYEATLAPEHWPEAIASVALAGGAHKAILHAAASCGPTLAVTSGFSADDVPRLQREIENRLPAWIEAIPTGTPLRQTSVISDADFRMSDLYDAAVRPAGGFYGIVAPLVRGADRRILLTLARNAGAADFTEDDVRATSVIGSHVVTAFKVWRRIAGSEGRASATCEAIARLNVGVVFLDETMRPLLANPCAEALARRAMVSCSKPAGSRPRAPTTRAISPRRSPPPRTSVTPDAGTPIRRRGRRPRGTA